MNRKRKTNRKTIKYLLEGGALKPPPNTRKTLKRKDDRRAVMFFTKDFSKNNELTEFEAYLKTTGYTLTAPKNMMELNDKLQNVNTVFPMDVVCSKPGSKDKIFKVYKNAGKFEEANRGTATPVDMYKTVYDEEGQNVKAIVNDIKDNSSNKTIKSILYSEDKVLKPFLRETLNFIEKNENILNRDQMGAEINRIFKKYDNDIDNYLNNNDEKATIADKNEFINDTKKEINERLDNPKTSIPLNAKGVVPLDPNRVSKTNALRAQKAPT